MEAANSGARMVPGAKTMGVRRKLPQQPCLVFGGSPPYLVYSLFSCLLLLYDQMGISLPFETGLNRFVTPELAWEYHYFHSRYGLLTPSFLRFSLLSSSCALAGSFGWCTSAARWWYAPAALVP